ncbi:hypothetical protein [Pseudarthrobacter defluvii]|uniref:hypothetical protein n=1 Tax=Pseudarthrobacter defluvii TaxID=410837 RepID=UPI0025785B77|nr:hypothetical protein [Pseudarthrobacter defluvii]WJH25419.1 hypothetical protein JCQ34_04865 [Pseudarthrobacter defluvii]
MSSDKSKFRQVLVDVAQYDKDGNFIPLDSLSSGGARNADGSLITQYRNPRLVEPANEPEADREFDEWLNREHEARLRRQEEAEELRHKEYAEIANLVVDNLVIPFAQNVVIPQAKELWRSKVLPGGKQLVRRWHRTKRGQLEVPLVTEDATQLAAETRTPLGTGPSTDQNAGSADVQSGGEDVPLVGVIVTDGCWRLDPPTDSVAYDVTATIVDGHPAGSRKRCQ